MSRYSSGAELVQSSLSTGRSSGTFPQSPFPFVMMWADWPPLRDLTEEGIEPNPGPVSVDHPIPEHVGLGQSAFRVPENEFDGNTYQNNYPADEVRRFVEKHWGLAAANQMWNQNGKDTRCPLLYAYDQDLTYPWMTMADADDSYRARNRRRPLHKRRDRVAMLDGLPWFFTLPVDHISSCLHSSYSEIGMQDSLDTVPKPSLEVMSTMITYGLSWLNFDKGRYAPYDCCSVADTASDTESLGGWIRNLTEDGDTESQPGPRSAISYATGLVRWDNALTAETQVDTTLYTHVGADKTTYLRALTSSLPAASSAGRLALCLYILRAGQPTPTLTLGPLNYVPGTNALPTAFVEPDVEWFLLSLGSNDEPAYLTIAQGIFTISDPRNSPVTFSDGDRIMLSTRRVVTTVGTRTYTFTYCFSHVPNVSIFTGDPLLPTQVSITGIAPLTSPIWCSSQRSSLPPIATGSDLANQKAHNALMHATNGNTAIQTAVGDFEIWSGENDFMRALEEGARRLGAPEPHNAPAQLPQPKRTPNPLVSLDASVRRVGATKEDKNPFSDVVAADVPKVVYEVVKAQTPLGFAVRYVIEGQVRFERENIFSIFWADEEDGHDLDTVPVSENNPTRSTAVGTRPRATQKKDDAPKKTPRVTPDTKDVRSAAELVAQREKVIARIVSRLKTSSEDEVVGWILRVSPKTSFAYEVLSHLWGRDFDGTSSWQRWFATCRLNPTQVPHLELGYHTLLHKKLGLLSSTSAWQEWFNDEYHVGWYSDSAVLAQEAAAHNREMHSSNGNPVFTATMKDVRELPTQTALYQTPISAATPEPWVTALEVSTVASSICPVDQDIPTAMPLRGDIVLTNNTVATGRQIHAPESLLQPRQVRDNAGGLINSTNRLRCIVAGLMSYQSSTLEDTELMRTIMEAAIRANQNLGRADNVTLGGFQAYDVAYIGRLKSYYGLSLQSGLARLLSLAFVNSWTQPRNTLPLSNEAGLYDPRTQLNPANNQTLSYNDSTIFDESCGANDAVLPWRGGDAGTVSFHLTLETVPEASRSLAVFVSPNLLMSDTVEGLSLFFFIMMWADWPTLMWTLTLPTLNSAGGGAANQRFIPHLSTLFIPGQTDLHIILPRRTAAANPKSQPTANSLSLIQPRAGPTPSANIAANELFDVNYVGAPALISYSLAEYSYTWGLEADYTSIVHFLQRLNDLVSINQEIKCVMEKLASVGIRYPPMVSQALDGTTLLPVNSPGGFTQITSVGIQATATTENWPQTGGPRPDILLFETDVVAYNKVVLCVGIAKDRMGTGEALTRSLGNIQSLYWLKLLARHQAVTMNVHLSLLGWPGSTWDNAYTIADMRSFRTIARGHYAGAVGGNLRPQPAQMGRSIASLFTALLGFSPTPDLEGNTLFDYITPPRSSRILVIDTAGNTLSNCIPVWLPDVWIQQTCRTLPRSLSSFPPQNNEGSTTGMITDDYVTALLGNELYGPMLRSASVRTALRQDDTRDDTDEEIWNARLAVVLVPTTTMRTLAGTLVAGGPAAGHFPKQAIITPDYTTPQWTTGFRSASTYWVPRVRDNGVVQFPAAARADMITISKIQAGQARAAIEIWALSGLLAAGDFKLGGDGPGRSQWVDMVRKTADVVVSSGGVQPSSQPAAGGGDEQAMDH